MSVNYKTEDGQLYAEKVGPNGSVWVPVGDRVGFEKARSSDSHSKFFGSKEDRQLLRRKAALERMVMGTMSEPQPPSMVKKTIADKTYMELHRTPKEDRGGILLLKEYIDKIMPPGKKVIRHPYPGEVGYYEKDGELVYLFLEEGYEKGHLIQNNPLAKVRGSVILTGFQEEPAKGPENSADEVEIRTGVALAPKRSFPDGD